MYIFQPDRHLLAKQVSAVAHYASGKMLDVGAGQVDRYGKRFAISEHIKMDVAAGLNVDVVGSADAIPLPDESIDTVLCTQVFEHLRHPFESAREIYRVLKPGGYFIMTVPQMNELHEEPHDFFRYTRYGLESMFSETGFTVVEFSQRGGFFSMVLQIKIRYLIDLLHLYKRPFLGRVFNFCFKVEGFFAILLDRLDGSVANRKHTIGWCFVLKK